MAAAAGLLLAAGCARQQAPAPNEPEPLAKVGKAAITEQDFTFEVERRKSTGRPVGTPREVLQSLIERQAMLQKAEDSEGMRDPKVVRELENRRLGQWLDLTLQAERDAVRVSDEELRAYYEANSADFTRPAMVRLAILCRKANARDPGDTVAALKGELEKARAAYLAGREAVTQDGRIPGFGTVAAENSEDTVSRYRGGDIGWLASPDSGGHYPEAVLRAGFDLEVGAVSDVIPAGDGLYVVMKADARPAQATPYEQAAPGLRRRLIRLKQEAVERSFMSNVLAEAQIVINEEKAARLSVPQEASPVPPALVPAADFAPGEVPR